MLRLAIAMASAGLSAGCFQPLYGQAPLSSGPTLQNALSAVDVQHIDAPRGSEDARIAVELRNALLFDLTGGDGLFADIEIGLNEQRLDLARAQVGLDPANFFERIYRLTPPPDQIQ